MTGWAVVPRDGVLIVDPEVARELAKGLDLLDEERRRNGYANGAETLALHSALAALAAGGAVHFRSDFRSEVPVRRSSRRMVSVAVAARMLDKTPRWVRQQCADGVLVAHRAGHVWEVDEEAVMVKARSAA